MDYSLETKEELEDVISRLRYADESEEYEKILQKCIQKCQVYKDRDLELEARLGYLNQVNWLKKKDKAIATLPWLLKFIDDGHATWQKDEILWMYKWVIASLPTFANISMPKIEALFADMERRFLEHDSGTKVIHYFKVLIYRDFGLIAKSKEYLELYKADTSYGSLDDCSACQPNNILTLHLVLNDYQAVLDEAKPLLEQHLTCREVPDITYPITAFSHMMLGNEEEAKKHAVTARVKLDVKKPLLDKMGYLLMYYALAKDFLKGRTVIEKQLEFCSSNQGEINLFTFYIGCLVFFKSFRKEGKEKIKLKLNLNHLNIPTVNDYTKASEIISVLHTELDNVVDRLDKRNGNDFYTDRKAYYLDLIKE